MSLTASTFNDVMKIYVEDLFISNFKQIKLKVQKLLEPRWLFEGFDDLVEYS